MNQKSMVLLVMVDESPPKLAKNLGTQGTSMIRGLF